LFDLGVKEKDIGTHTGAEKTKEVKKIMLGTYGSGGTGMDRPELCTLIMATPRADAEQAIGRILRLAENKKPPVVMDIVDTSSSIMRGWFEKRKKLYREKAESVTYLQK
jgi:superfamily II DNA or RNA helicase